MTIPNASPAIDALNQAFIHTYAAEAIRAANKLEASEVADLLKGLPLQEAIQVWDGLMLDVAATVITILPEKPAKLIMQHSDPVHTSRVLARLPQEIRQRQLALADSYRQRELNSLVQYPEDSAGSLMDIRFISLSESLTVREALARIRKLMPKFTRQLYLVDEDGRLTKMVEMHQLALANPGDHLDILSQKVPAVVEATATKEEVVLQLDVHRITDLPVIDLSGKLIGIIRYDTLMDTIREESSNDILTMVGVSKSERALSNIGFVVKKRLPWLSINLLTAFLAASVVGLFEATIAKFTALAVLLPVVAGQSGNTGAQALAVTMRGIALHEIGTSQWLKVAKKEIGASFINGIAIALLTSLGVLAWSGSMGLTMVIGISMVIAMVVAAFSGVVIPMSLSAIGQDPAQSSSILLTTVTDVVGFFVFLGIASSLSHML